MLSVKKLKDLAERSGATFLQAFAAAAIFGRTTDLSSLKIALIAGALAAGKFSVKAAMPIVFAWLKGLRKR